MNAATATSPQLEAINTDADLVVCVAGPGAGKTATVVARIVRIIMTPTDPGEIAAISFTNAAAGELQRRIAEQNWAERGLSPGETFEPKLGFVGTLHSFALRMLKEHGTPFGYGDRVALISPESAQDLIESKARSLGCKVPVKALLELKAAGRPPRGERLTLPQTVVAAFLDDLREAGVVDYDVLLQEFLAMLTNEDAGAMSAAAAIRDRFAHLFVDEVQDLAPLDWAIVRALPIRSKFLVGDPDQAVYGFRGGRVREMVACAADAGTLVVKLEDNFRSHSEICEAAQRLIERNRGRVAKVTRSVKGPGGFVNLYGVPPLSVSFENEGEEVAKVARIIKVKLFGSELCEPDNPRPSIAIIARTNAIAESFRGPLKACGVPVVERTKTDLPRDWRLARAFVELLCAPENDSLAFFYLVALYEKKGADPREARDAAHAVRRAAASVGKSINRANLGIGRVTNPENALVALAGENVSRESLAIAAERFRDLPAGATMLDLSLALAEVREHVKDGEGDGVRIMTIHGAKGREFDVVFLVGLEDEVCPGRAARIIDEAERTAAVEEERRLAYVGMTRARRQLFVTHAASRAVAYGTRREVVPRTPSRFIAEIAGRAF